MDHLQELGRYREKIRIPLGVEMNILQSSECDPTAFTFDYFQNFPKKMGWKLKDGNLDQERGFRIKRRGDLLQAWLFFGLIFTVLRNDEGSLVKRAEDLLLDEQTTDSKEVSTKSLKTKLKEWAQSERLPASADETTRRAVRMRIIRVGLVLNMARGVVRRYCSYTADGPEGYMYTSKPGKEQQADYMDDAVALSLLLLGETLSAVYMNILNELKKDGVQVSGWITEDLEGWGQPRWVLDTMLREGWCPRSIFLLRRQLGSHATLLLNACYSHRKSVQLSKELHQDCNDDVCTVTSPFKVMSTEYVPSHHTLSCKTPKDVQRCEARSAIGPGLQEIDAILDKLDNDIFPLVRLRLSESSEDIEGLEVLEGGKKSEYVTISHVWSDGYGNMESNKVWHCQLCFIRRLLKQAVNDPKMAFWMDTLVIPMGESPESKERRKKSIQQIAKIFKWSKCTVVLDRGLISLEERGQSTDPCLTAMRILSSGWMRRLWTLQEAFQSKTLWVAFEERGPSVLVNFDDVQEALRKKASDPDSVMASLIEEKMAASIMNGERWIRDANRPLDPLQPDSQDDKRKRLMIANSWRAARWRVSRIWIYLWSLNTDFSLMQTTSRAEHETVALATLLGIQESRTERYFSTTIANVGEDVNKPKTDADHDLEVLMKDFWTKVAVWGNGCIPPGIIFLPGKRMTLRGFGWAPKTFMNPEDVGHPNPLSLLTQKTELKPEHGLIVAYPGFMLHADDEDEETRNNILKTDGNFRFPVDNSFMEWYEVEPKPEPGWSLFQGLSTRRTQLAVLLSRPFPKESPPDVGLLVEIYNPEPLHLQNDPSLGDVRFAQIVFRVHVRRIHIGSTSMNLHLQCRGAIFGEAIPSDQRWCLDGYQPNRFNTTPAQTEITTFGRARRAATWLYLRRGETEQPDQSDSTSGFQRSDTAPPNVDERGKLKSKWPFPFN